MVGVAVATLGRGCCWSSAVLFGVVRAIMMTLRSWRAGCGIGPTPQVGELFADESELLGQLGAYLPLESGALSKVVDLVVCPAITW